jgi:tetratricopeptide (TPR) repeat protein
VCRQTSRELCAGCAARAVALIDRVLPARPWEHEQSPACARLLEHAMSAARYADLHDTGRKQTARVLARVGQYQHARAAYATARELLQRALAIQEAVYGPEHPDVASTLTNLGSVQQQLGEFAAARVTLQRALAIQEAVYGPEHPDVAITLTNLGTDIPWVQRTPPAPRVRLTTRPHPDQVSIRCSGIRARERMRLRLVHPPRTASTPSCRRTPPAQPRHGLLDRER